jgi:Ni/Fe-hydrogenase subunit HybB-like protein
MALYLCVRSLNVKLDTSILGELGRVIAPMLGLYGIFRFVDLSSRGALPYLFRWREETLSFWLEFGLLVVAPLVLLNMEKIRNNPQRLYWTCSLVVMGFMANRLNVSITGLQASSGIYYVPKWTEFAASLMVLTAVVMAFRFAVIYLDILPKNQTARWIAKEGVA